MLCQAYADSAMDGLDEADDFYSILGVVSYLFMSSCLGERGIWTTKFWDKTCHFDLSAPQKGCMLFPKASWAEAVSFALSRKV